MFQVCGDAFHTKRTLETHNLYRHSDVRQFKCDTCNLTFKTNSSLRRHARIHGTARPFKCHLCSTSFNRQSNLRRHLKNVHGSDDVLPAPYRVKVLDVDEQQPKDKNQLQTAHPVSTGVHGHRNDNKKQTLPVENIVSKQAMDRSGNAIENNGLGLLQTLAQATLRLPDQHTPNQVLNATPAAIGQSAPANQSQPLSSSLLAGQQAILSHLQLQENKPVLLRDFVASGVSLNSTAAPADQHIPLQIYSSQAVNLPTESPSIITLRTIPTMYSITGNTEVISSDVLPGTGSDKSSSNVVWLNQV